MGEHRILLVFLLSFFLSPSVTFAQHEPAFKEGELLVKFKSATSLHVATISHGRFGSQIVKHFRKTRVQLVKLRNSLTAREAIEMYKQDPSVEYAEPNYKLYALDVLPNDPRFNDLWGLHNTGRFGGTPGADIGALEAWQTTTGGSDVVVAVIDSGVEYNHEDLSANMWTNDAELNGSPWIDDDGNGYVDDIYGIDAVNKDSDPMDDEGHGTHCSGTIGAVGDNGIGVVGVNWDTRIMALKFIGPDGIGLAGDAIECLEYAIDMKQNYGHNIRVINGSWGGGEYSQSMYDTIQAAKDADILFVAAAGNDAQDNDTFSNYPSSYALPNIISVAATDQNDALGLFSNWGLTSVDVAAPGVNIVSSTPGNNYESRYGTSMAVPHVCGLITLILSQHPEYSWNQVKWNILLSVDAIASLNGIVSTGGRINANSALTCNPDVLQLQILTPSADFERLLNGQTIIRASVLTCTGPVDDVTVTVDFGNVEPNVTLYDDGVSPDVTANDGEYAAFWTPQVPGQCILTITALASGYNSVSEQIFGIVAYLTASLSAEPTSGPAPLTVQFTDESTGSIDTWQWDFGDGGTSAEQNPSHEYTEAGDYTVFLTVTGPGGTGSDDDVKADYIHVTDSICECHLVPDDTTVSRGGTLGFQASVTNNTGGMGMVLFGTKVTKPDESQTGFIWGPLQVWLNYDQTKSGHKTHTIPSGFELGTFTYHGYVGKHGNIYDECQFDFEVVP